MTKKNQSQSQSQSLSSQKSNNVKEKSLKSWSSVQISLISFIVLIVGIVAFLFFENQISFGFIQRKSFIENEIIMASTSDIIIDKFWPVECAKNYEPYVENCTPIQNCGRFLTDNFIDKQQLFDLVSLANGAMTMTPGE
jgi:hypothetical protein